MDLDQTPFDAIVLSGGGTKGIIQLGALHYYYEKGLLDLKKTRIIAATSIGSVIGLLMAIGMSPMDIFTEVYAMDSFFTVKDCQNLWDLMKNYGLMSIRSFTDRIEKVVKSKYLDDNGNGVVPTLKQLYERTGVSLRVPVTNVSKMREERFDEVTKPNLSAMDAVKMSCNLPLIFQRVFYNGNYYVDGGLLNNFPLDYAKDAKKVLAVIVMGSDAESETDISFINYIYRLIVLPINTITDLRSQKTAGNVTLVKIVSHGAPILEFDMSGEKKMDLFMKGYHQAEIEDQKQYLTVKGWEPMVKRTTVANFDGWDFEKDLD